MKSKKAALLGIIAILFYFITVPALAIGKKPMSYLFIQTAKTGELQPTKQSGVYQLVLHDVSPYVTYFTERPNRISGLVPLPKFLAEWNKGGSHSFKADAPNTGLEAHKINAVTKEGDNVTLIVDLMNPSYNAKNNTLSYKVNTLPSTDKPILSPVNFKHVALFIDDARVCFGCGGGGFF